MFFQIKINISVLRYINTNICEDIFINVHVLKNVSKLTFSNNVLPVLNMGLSTSRQINVNMV
jgi:hypothetical protein